jgi:hypothetical protein
MAAEDTREGTVPVAKSRSPNAKMKMHGKTDSMLNGVMWPVQI